MMRVIKWGLTKHILNLVQDMEGKMKDLERCGLTIPQLEYTQSELILMALRVNGISRNDDVVDWLCEPIFRMLWGETEMNVSMKELDKRLRELKQDTVRKINI